MKTVWLKSMQSMPTILTSTSTTGVRVGTGVGSGVGSAVGGRVGSGVGCDVGNSVGPPDGNNVGAGDGGAEVVGIKVSLVGAAVVGT